MNHNIAILLVVLSILSLVGATAPGRPLEFGIYNSIDYIILRGVAIVTIYVIATLKGIQFAPIDINVVAEELQAANPTRERLTKKMLLTHSEAKYWTHELQAMIPFRFTMQPSVYKVRLFENSSMGSYEKTYIHVDARDLNNKKIRVQLVL